MQSCKFPYCLEKYRINNFVIPQLIASYSMFSCRYLDFRSFVIPKNDSSKEVLKFWNSPTHTAICPKNLVDLTSFIADMVCGKTHRNLCFVASSYSQVTIWVRCGVEMSICLYDARAGVTGCQHGRPFLALGSADSLGARSEMCFKQSSRSHWF